MEEEEEGNVDRGERSERTAEDAESQNPRCYSYPGMILLGVQVKIILEKHSGAQQEKKEKERGQKGRGGEGRKEEKQTY